MAGVAKLETEIDKLFQLPLAEFTRARNALAKAAGPDGADIKSLTKPPVAAWAVNQLYWHNRDTYTALIEAADQMRRAHKAVIEGRSGDLRASGKAHEAALDEALKATLGIMKQQGQPVTEATKQAILNTLRALPADEPPGRLTRTLAPGGFEMLAGIAVGVRRGPSGFSGPSGRGPSGPSGRGPSGPSGRGPSGPSGRGPSGPSGRGPSGPSGRGPSGPSGRGPSGPSGRGPSGQAHAKGTEKQRTAADAKAERDAARVRERQAALERAVREADQRARQAEFEAARTAREAVKQEKVAEQARRAFEEAREALETAEKASAAAARAREAADRRVRETRAALDAARSRA